MGLLDPHLDPLDPDPSIITQNSKKNLGSYGTVLWILDDFLSLKNDVYMYVPSKSIKQENFFLNLLFVGVLKVNDENSRIYLVRGIGMDPRIRIHTKMSWIRNTLERI